MLLFLQKVNKLKWIWNCFIKVYFRFKTHAIVDRLPLSHFNSLTFLLSTCLVSGSYFLIPFAGMIDHQQSIIVNGLSDGSKQERNDIVIQLCNIVCGLNVDTYFKCQAHMYHDSSTWPVNAFWHYIYANGQTSIGWIQISILCNKFVSIYSLCCRKYARSHHFVCFLVMWAWFKNSNNLNRRTDCHGITSYKWLFTQKEQSHIYCPIYCGQI